MEGDKIELEKAPKDWLERMLETWGAELFGIDSAVIIEPIKKAVEIPLNRAEKRREK
ncbi:MAG: hypothetical protein PHC52_13575 [Syntrophales bacterium]|nr:hypothetical protein [Syntrophales bacterium]